MVENENASRQPAKQRKAQANAPQHRRREMMSAHLSEDLMLEYDRRSIALRTGDQVEVMRGDFAGHEGEILEIDYGSQEIEVDGAVNRSSDGSQVARPIHASNVRITELDLTDPQRRAKLERKGVTVEEPEPEPEPEEPEAEEAEEAEEVEEETEHVEPAEGAKGPDVADVEPPQPEPEPEAELPDEPETEEGELEAPEPDAEVEEETEPEPEAPEPEEDEAEADADEPETEAEGEDEADEPVEAEDDEPDEDTDQEGSA